MTLRLRSAIILFCSWTAFGCSDDSSSDPPDSTATQRAYVGGTVIPAPDRPAIEDGVVLIEGSRIVAVGERSSVVIPRGATRIDCAGSTLLAGFWNSHVHFMAPEWNDAPVASASALTELLREMLTSWGFVHVVDTGSELANTLALRERIDAGELPGPSILSAGPPLIAVGGQPRYVPVPLPELSDPEQTRALVTDLLDAGADGIKLMTASVVEDPPPPVMPHEVVRAATQTAHERGALVFAHPTNADGLWAAVDGGVDVVTHTVPEMGPWTADSIARLVEAGVSLTPTLSLFRFEMEKDEDSEESILETESLAMDQLRSFHEAGGTALFGTDVGYTTLFDPSHEYQLLERAGLDFATVLTMLTTAPATRFAMADRTGRLVPGADADLVILRGDPRRDVAAWTRTELVLRAGETLFER